MEWVDGHIGGRNVSSRIVQRALAAGLLFAFVAAAFPSFAEEKDQGFLHRKKDSGSSSTSHSQPSEKDPWWKFWGKDREPQDEQTLKYGWKGWTNTRGHEPTESRKSFTTKVKKHRKPGESNPRNRTVSTKKSSPKQANQDPGWNHRIDKRYNQERYQHKDGKFRIEDTKKKPTKTRTSLNWPKPPPRETENAKSYSHKNGEYRREKH